MAKEKLEFGNTEQIRKIDYEAKRAARVPYGVDVWIEYRGVCTVLATSEEDARSEVQTYPEDYIDELIPSVSIIDVSESEEEDEGG